MKKAAITILIVMLLTLNMFGLIVNTLKAAPKTWTVDDDGPADFHTIQEAINAASSGDTILVATGTYPEYVCVNKSVNLKGTNRESKITGAATPSRVVDVKTSNVEISGFTIQGPTKSYHGIWVEPSLGNYFTNVNITDNTVIGGNTGIFYSRSSGCYVTNNTLDHTPYGIRLYDSNYNSVAENLVNGSSYYGINFYARSHHNNITENTIINGKYAVVLEYANYTTMYLNMIKSNTEYAIRFSYTFHSLIKGNTMENNKWGAYIWDCSQNQFYYNNFIDNTIQVEHYAVPLDSNIWDTDTAHPYEYLREGNYWSDYGGIDDGSGVGRSGESKIAGDGIGDTLTPHLGLDWYPLMWPWTPVPLDHPVAIFTWSPPEPIHNLPAIFNASKSYDTDGSIISYKWDFDDGNITTVTYPIITHVFAVPGDYTVTLTVTDDDLLTNSTSHLVRVLLYKLEIDVYTQHPEPYSGRGPNQPSDAFEPQSEVILYAEVKYNYEPVENKMVSFEVRDPNSEQILYRENNTDANGITSVKFRLASNATFGVYTVFAQVTVSERTSNDTLTFLMGWIIEIINVETMNHSGVPTDTFAKGEQVYFSIDIKNIAFTSRNATLTIALSDETGQPIGAADISLTVPPGTHEYNLITNILIPQWTFIGHATAHVNAFTNWPWDEGVPYCPQYEKEFVITPS